MTAKTTSRAREARLKRLRHLNGHKTLERTGGEVIAETLMANGSRHLFGIPGGANLPQYDALPQYEKEGEIQHFLMGHEQGAGHAAQGYARASGRLGVCLATSGPGATNLVTPLQDAKMDSTGILAITGQVGTHLIGTDAFQETPVFTLTQSVTKHNYLVKDVDGLQDIVQQGMHLATTGRPGPVLIDVPKNIAAAKTIPSWRTLEESVAMLKGHKPSLQANLDHIEEAMSLINKSERPVLYIGGGVVISDAHKELYRFATEMGIPVTTTFPALGAFPGTHKLYAGPPGMHGTVAANYALNLADCIIAVGTRFDDRVTGKTSEFARRAKVIHIEIESAEINKIRGADIPINADAKEALTHLVALADKTRNRRGNYKNWRNQVEEWKKGWPTTYEMNTKGKITPQWAVETLYEMAPNAIVATGIGQHQMYTTQFWKFTKPRNFISSLGLATMGYGLPAAIGAQVARPGELVIDIDGDGSFNMTVEELAVLGKYRLPVKVVILDNKFLGMVDQWQKGFYNKNRSAVNTAYGDYPNFVKIAAGYNVPGRRVSNPEEVRSAYEEMLTSRDPFVLQLDVDEMAEVDPIVGPGMAWHEMRSRSRALPVIPEYKK